MSCISSDQSLLDELDARQDEVLEALDQLNARIERLLKECLVDQSRVGPASLRAPAHQA